MSDAAAAAPAETQSKPIPTRDASSDKHAFAQVEKWMAMIREVSRERPEPTKFRA